MGITISKVNIEDRKKIGVRAGDTVRVSQKIQEKGKTRIQVFEGLVLARKHGNEPGATFTVRKVSKGFGVEKIFPLYSPMIDKIEIIRRSKVRRAKLYFIREKVAREIKKQMRNMRIVDIATKSDIEEKENEIKTEDATKIGEKVEAAESNKEESVNTLSDNETKKTKNKSVETPKSEEPKESKEEAPKVEEKKEETPKEEAKEE